MKKILVAFNLYEELVDFLHQSHRRDFLITGFFVKPEYQNLCVKIDAKIPYYPMDFKLKYGPFKNEISKNLIYGLFSDFGNDLYYLLDRILKNDKLLSATSKENFIYNYLFFLQNILLETKPDVVIFNTTPHNVMHLILYWLAKKNNIKTLIIYEVSIGKKFFSYKECFKEGDLRLKKFYNELKENEDFNLSHLNNYYNLLQGDYEVAIPKYEKENWSSNYKIDIKKINKKRVFDYLNVLKSKFHRRSLINFLRTNSSEFDSKSKYLYFALHYQPERTSVPEGDIFHNFYLCLKLLSNSIPEDWIIYVKDHPSYFKRKIISTKLHRYRNLDFYKLVSSIPKVKLLHDVNSFELIDNSLGVITLTGTVGLESLARGKPVICFGYPSYNFLDSVYQVTNSEEISFACRIILNKNYTSTKIDLKKFLYAIENCFIHSTNGDLSLSEGYTKTLIKLTEDGYFN